MIQQTQRIDGGVRNVACRRRPVISPVVTVEGVCADAVSFFLFYFYSETR